MFRLAARVGLIALILLPAVTGCEPVQYLDDPDQVFLVCADPACQLCRGSGYKVCRDCDGTGITDCPRCQGGRVACPVCYGNGIYDGTVCAGCEGRGEVLCPVCAGEGQFPCGRCLGSGLVRCGVWRSAAELQQVPAAPRGRARPIED